MGTGNRAPGPDLALDFDVVGLAASSGGLHALTEVLSTFGVNFPAAIVIVQHLGPQYVSHMAALLGRRTALRVRDAFEGCRLEPGFAWVAPPDRHMIVDAQGVIALTQSARVHFVRPSADPLFESMAVAFRKRAIAVILTGSGSDGAAGARAIKNGGGTVIIQDEATSASWGMPRAVLATGCADMVLPLAAIGPALLDLLERRREYERR
jgi:two-component system chemotaxis response regulator CheB